MSKLKITIFALLLLGFCTSGYAADDQTSTQIMFSELYGKLQVAMNARDMGSVATMLAPEFQSEDVSGNIQNAESMLSGLAKLPQDKNKKSQTTIVSVVIDGASAKVTQRYQMTTIKTSANGQRRLVQLVTVSDDIWNHTGNVWTLFRTVTRQMDYSVDGQVLVHKIHAAN